jgi:hypothetical protein
MVRREHRWRVGFVDRWLKVRHSPNMGTQSANFRRCVPAARRNRQTVT